MRTKWDDALFDRVRDCAAAGRTMSETARMLSVPPGSLNTYASKKKISFINPRSKVAMTETRPVVIESLSIDVRCDALPATLSLDLRREIALAIMEAGTAPAYRPRESDYI